ncbi:NHLP leader peptide domain-containing protein [Desulfonauticus submarinus]|uniref:NHLP leader peptide domain-containing protein n=1 Tax=Desulfonauticus submarinus TaxID=206665 RepID=A0A1H0FDY7_9BACT|nr:nitrile hydratase subunit alpha [Desulfonauticus submarinus]SDN92937.1 NHLP leader peptide domain-containing protein [Desulfonauticus submarinus]
MKEKELLLSLLSDAELMAKFKENPKAVLKEKGIDVPEDVEIRVVEETEKVKYFVIPYVGSDAPASIEELEQRTAKYWIIA